MGIPEGSPRPRQEQTPSRTSRGRDAARTRRAAARARDLDRLLQQRPELAGVHRAADLAVEAIRWSA